MHLLTYFVQYFLCWIHVNLCLKRKFKLNWNLNLPNRSFPKRASRSSPTSTWWTWLAVSARGHQGLKPTGSKRGQPSTWASPLWATLSGWPAVSSSFIGFCLVLMFSLSFSALADVAVGKRVVHIPYRDSVLTKLLQSALGGNSRTVMVNICGNQCWLFAELSW